MAAKIEDYALIGDCETSALVSRAGSIDWLSFPRFDSAACFAALLGNTDHGRWLLAPREEPRKVRRRYRGDTLILETDYETSTGAVTVMDFMPPRDRRPDLVRLVVGRRGKMALESELVIRFDYGALVPWVRKVEGGMLAVAGPDSLRLRTDVPLEGKDFRTCCDFTVAEGQRIPFVLSWYPSHEPDLTPIDVEKALERAESFWDDWSEHCTFEGEWREAVVRSLITLKALTYAPTGGIVAAATTSLPEKLGGSRNWDYRFCWLRDATFTLYAFLTAGYVEEAREWRDWLVRAVAGKPSQIQSLYGVAGERRLTELELDWLPGYEGSRPVRTGNAACRQFQLDVFGEVIDAIHFAHRRGMVPDDNAWRMQRELLDHLERVWKDPDEGLWEVRKEREHFTHSKMMSWVAVDRAIKAVEDLGLEGPADRWRKLRDEIRREIFERAYDKERGVFVQAYDSRELDASVLMMPLVGFLPAEDPRMTRTIEAIRRELVRDGFVYRYSSKVETDGLPPGEGAFLLCTFWLADNLALLGRHGEAREIFEGLLAIRNDVGLLSEEYDPEEQRLVGNFPQAFSHVALVNTAHNLTRTRGPAEERKET